MRSGVGVPLRLFAAFLLLSSCLPLCHANWFQNLWDPDVSLWTPFQHGSADMEEDMTVLDIGTLVFIGDFNNDGYSDLVFRYESPAYVYVYLWSSSSNTFLTQPSLKIQEDDMETISNVIASDFNYDGIMDLLIQYSDFNSTTLDGTSSKMKVYIGSSSNGGEFCSTSIDIVPAPSVLDHVMILDANMDMKVDLFGMLDGARTFWINNGDAQFTASNATGMEGMDPIARPHSNAFVDINGDCLADLVVISEDSQGVKSMELYTNSDTSGTPTFDFFNSWPLPNGVGQLSFSDFDRSGSIDIIFPVCYPENSCSQTNSIFVAYNDQPMMCTSITGGGSNCTDSSDICSVTTFSLPANFTETSESLIEVPATAFGNVLLNFRRSYLSPNTLRVGDYNMDGFPDLLVSVAAKNNGSAESVQLWKNVPCNSTSCPSTTSPYRTFQATDNAVLQNYTSAFVGTFFDLYEDGSLDILLLTETVSTQSVSVNLIGITNNVEYDAYFLKATGTNGVCTQWCQSYGDAAFPDPKPIGTNMPGLVIKYTQTDDEKDNTVSTGNPLTQSAYLALQTPYQYFGLGGVSNYINSIWLGIPITGGKTRYLNWPDVLPNSHVQMFPSPPTKTLSWKFDQYLMPSGLTFYTFLVTLVFMLGVAIASMWLARKEAREDKEERKKNEIIFAM